MGMGYKDLIVWQEALKLAELVYSATRSFPRDELYGLVSQMRRAAVSVASNIAEGQARITRGEFLQFLGHARGSLAELNTQSVIAHPLKMLQHDDPVRMQEQIATVGRLLNALISSLAANQDN
jgi:four helix bundle protein